MGTKALALLMIPFQRNPGPGEKDALLSVLMIHLKGIEEGFTIVKSFLINPLRKGRQGLLRCWLGETVNPFDSLELF